MPNFLENFFAQLEKNASRVVIREIHGESFLELSGGQLLQQIRRDVDAPYLSAMPGRRYRKVAGATGDVQYARPGLDMEAIDEFFAGLG